jgi:hypothetical protein
MMATLLRVIAAGMMILLIEPLVTGQSTSDKAVRSTKPRTVLTLDEKLENVPADFDVSGKSMTHLVLDLAYQYQLPMGIEHVTADALYRPLNLRLKRRNLKEIISTIVQAVPGFQVDFSGGLVDIFSPMARLDASIPLNTTIHAFDVSNLDTHWADYELFCVLERQMHPHSGCGGSIAPGQWGDLRITLHLQNKHVYEALNAIVAQNGRAVWARIFPLPRKPGDFISLGSWHIYPLSPHFESAALEDIEAAFPHPPTYERP